MKKLDSLRNTRLSIEKFVYEKGTNVALYRAEQAEEYQAFQSDVESGLMKAIRHVADYKDTLPMLLSLAKAAGGPLVDQVGALIATVSLGESTDLSGYLAWAGSQGGQGFLDKLGINGVFGLTNPQLIEYFGNYANLTIDSVDTYTKEWIAGKIQEGKELGLTPFEIQQSLIDDGKNISAIRAERIVLTETAHAMGVIELESIKRAGIKEYIWRTSRDERVCPICSPLEGQRVNTGKSFTHPETGAIYQFYPAHVSCRCYIEEVIPDDFVVPEKIWLGA